MKASLKVIAEDERLLDEKSMEEITGRSIKQPVLNPPRFDEEKEHLIDFSPVKYLVNTVLKLNSKSHPIK